MRGLMMDYQLTIPAIMRRAERLSSRGVIVSQRADRSRHRYTYAEFIDRARRLASGLLALGLRPGDRVATLCWNHHEHLEAYFGVPLAGGITHTLNLRLHPDELTYIVEHARDRFLLVDASLWPIYDAIRGRVGVERVIVIGSAGSLPEGAIDYERLLAESEPAQRDVSEPHEDTAAALCYTSGTTGRPKGALYSHRALVLQSLIFTCADGCAVSWRDAIMPVAPMFHANAWGLPYTAVLVGAKLVLPGPLMDPASLAALAEAERATFLAGVPTLWAGLLQALDRDPGKYDLSSVRAMLVGGAAVPAAMIEAFERRHGLHIVHAWGMTETSPLGTVTSVPPELDEAGDAERLQYLAMQGRPAPFVELRVRVGDQELPWDGATMGELEVRGPAVIRAYFGEQGSDTRFTTDGWFRTGDIATIDSRGYVSIRDRTKDLIKSGGEWISSVALEGALMGHPSVLEAAVIAVPHSKWGERPLAVVVLKPGASVSPDELTAFLAERFARWQLPDWYEFVDAIPKTSVGKFQKTALRERFKHVYESAT